MCQVLKMSTLSDHAFPMHLHLYPPRCITRSVLILTGSWCNASARARQGCAFRRPRFSRAAVWSSGIPLGSALAQVKMQLLSIACVGHLIPQDVG